MFIGDCFRVPCACCTAAGGAACRISRTQAQYSPTSLHGSRQLGPWLYLLMEPTLIWFKMRHRNCIEFVCQQAPGSYRCAACHRLYISPPAEIFFRSLPVPPAMSRLHYCCTRPTFRNTTGSNSFTFCRTSGTVILLKVSCCPKTRRSEGMSSYC